VLGTMYTGRPYGWPAVDYDVSNESEVPAATCIKRRRADRF